LNTEVISMMTALPKPYVPVTQLLLAVMKMAAEHHRAGRHAAARAMYQEVLELDPRHADAWFLLGVLERQQGRLEEAQRSQMEAARWAADRVPIDAELRLLEHLLQKRRRKPTHGWSASYCYTDCSALSIAARA
jgi:tetratricopeptide (TPR) repeat protein